MKRVEHKLTFKKSLADLAGNRFGRKIYEDQVKPSFDPDAENIVIIPDSISYVGTSFIQGIYAELSETYGRRGALQKMTLKSDNEETMNKIEKSISIYGI